MQANKIKIKCHWVGNSEELHNRLYESLLVLTAEFSSFYFFFPITVWIKLATPKMIPHHSILLQKWKWTKTSLRFLPIDILQQINTIYQATRGSTLAPLYLQKQESAIVVTPGLLCPKHRVIGFTHIVLSKHPAIPPGNYDWSQQIELRLPEVK